MMLDESGYVVVIWAESAVGPDTCDSGTRPFLSATVFILRGGSRNSGGVLSDDLSTVMDLPCVRVGGGGAKCVAGWGCVPGGFETTRFPFSGGEFVAGI